MDLPANRRFRVGTNVVTRITRQMPGEGKISAVTGQELTSGDIIATAAVPLGFHSFNLAEALGVPKSLVPNYLQKKVGDRVYKGELLATRSALFGKKNVLAPTDAIFEDYSKETGEIKLKFSPKNVSVTSGVYGIVEKVDQAKGQVVIKTVANIIHGLVGVGIDRGGVLTILGEPGSLFDPRKITPELRGHILVVGGFIYGNSFERAALIRVSGIVSGGINVRDYKSMAGNYHITKEAVLEPEISVMATEGFGTWPIGDDIYSALKGHEGKFAFLDGKSKRLLLPSVDPDSIITLRKVALPENHQSEAPIEIKSLQVGLSVRIIWPPFAGYIGKIAAIDSTPTTLPAGIATFMVTVETKIRKIKVPYNNLELIQ